jgi:hypothetical protein
MSLWFSLGVAAFAVFAAMEPILWLVIFNLLVACFLFVNYMVLRRTPVVRLDETQLIFNRTLLRRYRLALEGLETVRENDWLFVLQWRDGTELAISKRHFRASDLSRVWTCLRNLAPVSGRAAGVPRH